MRGQAVTLSIPTEPTPAWAAMYRRIKEGSHVVSDKPILKLVIPQVLGVDLLPGVSVTVHVGGEFEVEIKRLAATKDIVLLTAHSSNKEAVLVTWEDEDAGELSEPISPGRTASLQLDTALTWALTARTW